MGISYPLDRIIRRVHESEILSLDEGQKIFYYEAKNKNFLDKKPLFSMGKDIRKFVVSPTNTVSCEGPQACTIKDFSTDKYITLIVTYEASCEAGCEKKLIHSTSDSEHPGAYLNKQIELCIQRFAKKKSSGYVIQNIFYLKAELREEIIGFVKNDMGLHLDMKIRLEYEDKLKPHSIASGYFPVHVKDYNHELNLKFKAELDVYENNKIAAILSYRNISKFESLIKDITKKIILDGVTLHQFYYDLNGSVRKKLLIDINKKINKCGRTLTVFSLESSKITNFPENSIQIKHDVQCEIKGFNETIVVEHKLLLNLKDVGRLRASNINNLEVWIREQLEVTTRSVFFGKAYAELILEFNPDEIENIIKEKSELVGYDVKQLIVIPNLEPLKLKDGFSIDHKGKFATHDSRVEVKLNIVVSGVVREKNLKNIRNLLTPTTNIQEEMEGLVVKETQQFLHKIDPERFYLRFNYSDIENEPPVEQELINAITETLKTRFYAEDIHVTLKIMETELTERFQKLQQSSPYYFDIEVFPLRTGGCREQVTYRVGYEVAGIDKDRWYVFQTKKFQSLDEQISKIQEVLKEDLKANMDTVPAEYIQYADIKQKIMIEENLINPSIAKIMERFGLVIDIDLRRHETAAELAEQNKLIGYIASQSEIDISATEISNQAHLDELKMLYEKRNDLIKVGEIDDDDPEIINVNNKIKKITRKISSYSVENKKKNIKQLTTDSKKVDFSFDDFKKSTPLIKEPTKKIENKECISDE